MRLRRVRFTLRRMMVAVALTGVNLAAALATSRYYPRPAPPTPVRIGNGRGYVSYLDAGRVEYGEGNAETGYRMTRVVLLPPRPTLVRIWSPVVAGLGGSVLVLGWWLRRRT